MRSVERAKNFRVSTAKNLTSKTEKKKLKNLKMKIEKEIISQQMNLKKIIGQKNFKKTENLRIKFFFPEITVISSRLAYK